MILAVLSDTHGGNKLGLLNPDVTLFDEGANGELVPYKPEPTASATYLWKLYHDNLWQLQKIACGDPVAVLHNGDIAQGNRFQSELVSTRMADQILIGAANLRPLLEYGNVRVLRLAIGTEAHVFGEGSAEILVADTLKREYPEKDIQVFHQSLTEFNGMLVDYAHHGPPAGSRAWLNGNVARYYLQSLMMAEIMEGRTPPRLYLRAHVHSWVMETVTLHFQNKDYISTVLVTPSYCMIGEHGRKITRSSPMVVNGMAAIEIVDGRLGQIHRLTETLDIRSKETIWMR